MAGSDDGYRPLCGLDELEEGRARGFEVEGRLLAAFRQGDRVAVLSGRCPHAGGLMGHGWIEEGQAVCPLHRWHFRLDDGRCTSVRGEWVRVYPVRVLEGVVQVRL